jgi:hypothetical protein
MAIELSDDEVRAMQELASDSLDTSTIEYRRLYSALCAKSPALTDDAAISRIIERGDDKSIEYAAALACSYYKIALLRGRDCIALLREGRANGEVILNLRFADSGVWRALGAMAVVLNGGPLAQRFIDDAIDQRRETDFTSKDIQIAFDELSTKTGKSPSQRAVSKRSGYSR